MISFMLMKKVKSYISHQSDVGISEIQKCLAKNKMNLSRSMALSDVFGFGVNSILQGSSNAQSLLYSKVDVLFDIPLIGLFKAVRFENYSFHVAILL